MIFLLKICPLSHSSLTHSPSSGRMQLQAALLAGQSDDCPELERHPGEVSSEAFRMFLKKETPLSTGAFLEQSECVFQMKGIFPKYGENFQVHVMGIPVDDYILCYGERDSIEWG